MPYQTLQNAKSELNVGIRSRAQSEISTMLTNLSNLEQLIEIKFIAYALRPNTRMMEHSNLINWPIGQHH